MNKEDKAWLVRGAFITHMGQVYDHNEDACFFNGEKAGDDMEAVEDGEFEGDLGFVLAVADGIGGAQAGEIASRIVVNSFSSQQVESPEVMTEHLRALNRAFFEQGQKNPNEIGMGATVAGLCRGDEGLFAFNVGDTRVYRKQDNYLAQITKDDSVAQVLVDAGKLAPDATRNKKLHQITQAIGGGREFSDIDPHQYPVRVKNRADFLICSDGLHDMVSLDTIEDIIGREKTPKRIVESLFQTAMDNGGEDNITIIWVEIQTGKT